MSSRASRATSAHVASDDHDSAWSNKGLCHALEIAAAVGQGHPLPDLPAVNVYRLSSLCDTTPSEGLTKPGSCCCEGLRRGGRRDGGDGGAVAALGAGAGGRAAHHGGTVSVPDGRSADQHLPGGQPTPTSTAVSDVALQPCEMTCLKVRRQAWFLRGFRSPPPP